MRVLAGEFGVSASTIRRDLDVLGADGLLRRVRGGGLSVTEADDEPFPVIKVRSADEKDAIAARAARIVQDGDVVLVDIGTTTARLAYHLRDKKITVITASLAVVDELRECTTVELVILGGVYRRSYLSMVGMLTEQALAELRANLCFISASGVTSDGLVMDTTGMEVPIKRAMMSVAQRRVLLADRDKFPGAGLLRIAGAAEFTALVTNDGADPDTLATFAAAGTEVITV